jgi:hypothetical protein
MDTRDPRFDPDCDRCCGLCCVAPPFSAGEDFAVDKGAHTPCPHLAADFRCEIHDHLGERGFGGCVTYDCYGAGQKVTQVTFGERDWRSTPEIARSQFEVFMVMRQLHESMLLLSQALKLEAARPLWGELGSMFEALDTLSSGDPAALRLLDVASYDRQVRVLLRRIGDYVGPLPPSGHATHA